MDKGPQNRMVELERQNHCQRRAHRNARDRSFFCIVPSPQRLRSTGATRSKYLPGMTYAGAFLSPFLARNLSMNDVSVCPARNSGSARIFRCSGIVVYTPSTMNISKRSRHARDRFFAVFPTHDQLRNQRIVIGRDHAFRVGGRVDPHAGATRRMKRRNLTCRRRELLRMLGIDPAFDGMAAVHDRPVKHVLQPLARGQENLAFHQINIRHHFRDRMLHLNSRIHLDEVEPPVCVHQKLDGSGVHVADV